MGHAAKGGTLMETALQQTSRSETQDREQERAAEEEEVKIIDLEEHDPLGESKRLRLTSALLRWQRAPHRRSWRLICTVSLLLLLVVLLSVSHLSPSTISESFRRAYAPQARPTPSALSLPLPAQRDGITCLRDAMWSPDIQRHAFLVHLLAPSASSEGVVLMNRDGAHTPVVLDQQNPLAPSAAEWDLERGVLLTSKTFPLPPALAYHWGPKGTLE